MKDSQPVKNRIIKGDDYVLLVEEIHSGELMLSKLEMLSFFLTGSDYLVADVEKQILDPEGWEFVFLQHYEKFITPTNLTGFSLVAMQSIPESSNNEWLAEIAQQYPDGALANSLTVSSHGTGKGFDVLQAEAEKITTARIKTLRNLVS